MEVLGPPHGVIVGETGQARRGAVVRALHFDRAHLVRVRVRVRVRARVRVRVRVRVGVGVRVGVRP